MELWQIVLVVVVTALSIVPIGLAILAASRREDRKIQEKLDALRRMMEEENGKSH